MTYEPECLEDRLGRIIGVVLGDLVYYTFVFGVAALSLKLFSKILKSAIAWQFINKSKKHNAPDQDDDLVS